MSAFTHRLTSIVAIFCLGIFIFSASASLVQAVPTPAPTSSTGTAGQLFGTINAPPGVDKYNADPRAANGLGIMIFFSNLLKLNAIVAGVWSLVNFAMAGLMKIQSADDSASTKKVNEKITSSVIGLVIIVGSYTLAGLVSLILFGDATFILNPTLTGVS